MKATCLSNSSSFLSNKFSNSDFIYVFRKLHQLHCNENTQQAHRHVTKGEKNICFLRSTLSMLCFIYLMKCRCHYLISSCSLQFNLHIKSCSKLTCWVSLQDTCCSMQSHNCRSTTVPHSTHSRISQQALQASLNKSRSLLRENFTQASD